MEAGKHRSPAERMGQPTEVAAVAVAEYHKRAFSRNHPVVTFAVLQVVLVFGLWAGFLLAAYAIDGFVGLDDGTPETLQSLRTMNYCSHSLILAPIAVVALSFCRFAGNNGLDRRWPLTTTAILAVIAGLIWSNIITSGPGHQPMLGLFIGLPLKAQPLLQSMLIFAIGGSSCWLGRRRQIVPTPRT